MASQNQLFEVADRQQGFFTAKQAEECGYARSNFHLKLASGEWTQEGRGIFCQNCFQPKFLYRIHSVTCSYKTHF